MYFKSHSNYIQHELFYYILKYLWSTQMLFVQSVVHTNYSGMISDNDASHIVPNRLILCYMYMYMYIHYIVYFLLYYMMY